MSAAKPHPVHVTTPAPSLARYSRVAIALHWALAVLITASFVFGVYMVDLPFSPARVRQYNWHKWAGITILGLSALRLLWRLGNQPPALDNAMPAWQVRASRISHNLLYVLFFAAPLAGWAYSSAAGFPIVYFGLIPLPDWVPQSTELASQLKLLHRTLTYGMAVFVVLHVLAAIKHHWIDLDQLLDRINPFTRPSQGTQGKAR